LNNIDNKNMFMHYIRDYKIESFVISYIHKNNIPLENFDCDQLYFQVC